MTLACEYYRRANRAPPCCRIWAGNLGIHPTLREMKLAHALPRTRGKPFDMRQLRQRYRRVMTASPKAACIIPHVRGDLLCSHRQGCVANVTGKINRYRKRCHSTSAMFTVRQMVGAVLPKSDTVRWELPYCQRIHVTLMFDMKGASRYESEHDTIHPVQRFG